MRRKVAAKKVAAEEREPEKERFSEWMVRGVLLLVLWWIVIL